jgi:NAD(P)-dependent dehydrogenase (short-subunit alcohol dehydrogenase family)
MEGSTARNATRFLGRTVIITGGSKGLGFAIAERMLAEGASVLITARSRHPLDDAVARLEVGHRDVFGIAGDVADESVLDDIVTQALDRWGKIDVLVNNAGVDDEASFLEIDKARWQYVLDVDLTAPFFLSQLVARHMVKDGGGSIVNIASIDGHVADGPFASYGAAKAGLIALTKYIAVELAPAGIRCNSISPGCVDTPSFRSLLTPKQVAQTLASFPRAPIGRLLHPEELAAACAYLASDEASGVTGTDLIVDGGTLADVHLLPTLAAES